MSRGAPVIQVRYYLVFIASDPLNVVPDQDPGLKTTAKKNFKKLINGVKRILPSQNWYKNEELGYIFYQ